MANRLIEKAEGYMFNVLIVDEWLVGLFKTNNDAWRFLEYLGERLAEGKKVPDQIYIFMIAVTGIPEDPVKILQTAKVVKKNVRLDMNSDKRTPFFVYTALHRPDPEVDHAQDAISLYWPQIEEVLNNDGGGV